ncbi:streptogrisin C [Friedmanniella luteola]|uniref:Streptogrisin C n=1 Tax=Friedmanniella luteola TaxID=546871 RepID=A0A1H1QA14_9ACTN|nr:S1 family peptidase [Friedmanniella luteola]SDS20332.1 streptogrisin C [Friedmanniella luteola]
MTASPRRRAGALLGVATATFVLAAGTAGPAAAAPAPPPSRSGDAAAAALARDTGVSTSTAQRRVSAQSALSRTSAEVDATLSPASSAGSWLDARTGTVTVAVTTAAAAARARALGATPKRVAHSAAQLTRVRQDLDGWARAEGAGQVVSWGVDEQTNAVRVRTTAGADDRVTAAFVRHARSHGSKVTVTSTTARVQPMADLLGGRQIEFAGYVCSVGFNARTAAGAPVMLTAGHCGEGYQTFRSGGTLVGKTSAFSFPGNDYARAPISSSWTARGRVSTWDGRSVAVKGSAAAAVGAAICKSGRTTGWTCGTVRAKNQTVNYSNDDGSTSVVSGLTETSTCTEGGDSGGANLSGTQAQGLTSGGAGYGSQGVCGEKVGQPNLSYIQPVREALSAYGLTLVTG